MRNDIYAVSITDEETRQTIKEAYSQYKVLLEPHGAVAWAGLMKYLKECGDCESLRLPGDCRPGQVPGGDRASHRHKSAFACGHGPAG